jgi:hypothetical protein
MTEYVKIDDITLEVAESIDVVREARRYTYNKLKQQESNLIKKAADFAKTIDGQLVEVRALIAKCDELGIKPPVIPTGNEETPK